MLLPPPNMRAADAMAATCSGLPRPLVRRAREPLLYPLDSLFYVRIE
jgi:hypothetical protein